MSFIGLQSPILRPAKGENLLPLEGIEVAANWDAERVKSGKRPWNWIEFAVDRCVHTYGNSPCTAALSARNPDKCVNGWETCQDRENFASTPYWLRVCEPVADVPRTFEFADDGLDNFIPLLQRFTHDPAIPDPGESLGVRVRFTAQLSDAPHHDIGIDKYALERVSGDANLADEGTAQAGTSTSLTLAADAPSSLAESELRLISGAGSVQERPIASYDGATKVATVEERWRTNLILRSEAFDNAAWSKGAITVTANVDADPDGELTAERYSNAGDTFNGFCQQSFIAEANKQYTFSISLRKISGTFSADGDVRSTMFSTVGALVVTVNNTIGSDLTDEYQRFTITGTASATGGVVFVSFRADKTCEIAMSRAQVEEGDEAGDYIKTEAAAITLPDATTEYEVREAFDPMTRGGMLRKLKARFPHYIGRGLRWYQGYLTDSPSLADFRRREYVMERFEGPDASGGVDIVSNDILRLLDDARAQAPAKSVGELAVALDDVSAHTQIDITTDEPTEYDLKTGETEDYVRIGEEVYTYTGTTVIADGVRLTGVTCAAPSPYTTEREEHDVGDLVQRCRYFRGTVPEVFEEVMVDYAGMDAGFIPTDEWTEEANTWAPETIERLVTEPEGCKAMITEIIQQTLTWAVWFDEIDQEIKFRAIRPADVDDDIPEITDASGIVAGSVQVMDLADKIINEVQVFFGQINPTGNRTDVENYRRGLLDAAGDSQSANELGQLRIKQVFARWHPSSNSGVVDQFARRTVNARSKNLVEVQFKLERKDENIRTAQFCDLTTLYLIDALGLPRTTSVQVLRVNSKGEEVTFKAREDFFREKFGRFAPVALDGLLWDDATEAQRARYMFLAQADGTFTNGDRGKALA